jgi:hypothetical protein
VRFDHMGEILSPTNSREEELEGDYPQGVQIIV